MDGKPGKTVLLGAVSVTLLVFLSLVSGAAGFKVSFIGWFAFLAMMFGGLLSKIVPETDTSIVWAYGISGGAALASIMFFVVPQALRISADFGVLGIMTGFLSGLALHGLSHSASHRSEGYSTVWSVSLHAVSAGAIIGLIYQQLPSISLLLGVAILSHKLPAGYIIADRSGEDYWKKLLLPASAVGATALLSFNYPVALSPGFKALFFGFSSGVFIHVALDFIPEPEPESHLRKLLTHEEDPLHHELESFNLHCIASTAVGAGIVSLLALLL